MYWSRWSRVMTNLPSHIERSTMDGRNKTAFISSDLHWPSGLTIDFLTSKLYWCDSFLDKVERINLDGTDRQVRILNSANIYFGTNKW